MICFAILHVQSSLACSMLLMTVLVDLMREENYDAHALHGGMAG